MIYLLEAFNYYNDMWMITFYFILTISVLLSICWTCYQTFIRGEKKKQPLKENIIYNQSDDVLENYDVNLKKKQDSSPKNNYQIKDYKSLNNDNKQDKDKND